MDVDYRGRSASVMRTSYLDRVLDRVKRADVELLGWEEDARKNFPSVYTCERRRPSLNLRRVLLLP